MDAHGAFTHKNKRVNLDDANGRAIWALGFLISKKSILPEEMLVTTVSLLRKSMPHLEKTYSTRSIALIIKGLYHYNQEYSLIENVQLIDRLSSRLVRMYEQTVTKDWKWFEGHLSYTNSVLPEALLYASIATGNEHYRVIARQSFDFLLSDVFKKDGMHMLSCGNRFNREDDNDEFVEQPIDVAYMIVTLDEFYEEFQDSAYLNKMQLAFNWFLGDNHLCQMVYNPYTGGCYDGIKNSSIHLNQSAESTLSYLMSRMTVDPYKIRSQY